MKYLVEQYVVAIDTHIVEAESKAEAIQKVVDGDTLTDCESFLPLYVETDEDKGMSWEEDPELARALAEAGVISWGYYHIPSICSVKEMKQ